MGCSRHKMRPSRRGLGGDIVGGVLSGAGAGASLGVPGIIGGAIVGGVTGIFKNKREKKLKEKAMMRQRLSQEAGDYFQDLSYLQAFDNQFNARFGLDMGTKGSPMLEAGFNAEFEPTEISQETFRIEGPDHNNGGVDVDPNFDGIAEYELEGGEIVNGTKVYSKRLKVPQGFIDYASDEGITLKRGSYADVAESLGRRKDKYLEKMDSIDEGQVNTGMLMNERIENLFETLFYTQEFSKLNRRSK